MNVLGELNIAGLERLGVDPVDNLFEGRMYLRSTDNKPRIYIGGIWSFIADNIDITGAVASVNGLEGVVVLTTSNIAEGTNEYFTVAKAKAASVDNAIQDNVTDKAPSQEAVHTALAGKQDVGSYLTQLTGDVSAVGPGIGSATLSSTGVTPGTYTKIQVDAKGRVLSGTSLVASDVPSLPANKLPLATSSVDGYLSGSDWTTFNEKQSAGDYITELTGDVAAIGPGSAIASILPATVVGKTLTGLSADPISKITASDTILSAFEKVGKRSYCSDLGNGYDTDFVYVPGSHLMTRNQYFNNCTVDAGATVNTGGYAIFCRGTLTVNGLIHRNGPTASGSSGAGGATSAYTGASGAGQGGTSAAGAAGGARTASIGASSGSGGSGSGGSGGAVGAASPPTGADGSIHLASTVRCAVLARTPGNTPYTGGGGGGGGGGNGSASGGGGGGGGGVVLIVAGSLAGTGTIAAKGGNGGPGQSTDCGGGGGGGGGAILLVTDSDATSTTVTLDVSGGTGGASGGGVGVAGNNGSTGNVIKVRL